MSADLRVQRTDVLLIGGGPGRLTGLRPSDQLEISGVSRVSTLDAAVDLLRCAEGPVLVEGASLLSVIAAAERRRPVLEEPRLALAEVLHDMRHALVVITGYAEVLDRQPQPTPKTRTYVQRITTNARDLQSLLDEVLDLVRTETGRLSLNLSDVTLERELEHVRRAYELHANTKGLTLVTRMTASLPAAIRTDALRLRRMVGNMVANAIQYTTRGRIEIEMGYSSGMLSVTVSDTGPGIPAEYRDSIFEPFERGAAESSSAMRSTGLGLSAVRRMARLMGGDVVLVRSDPKEGSVFRLTVCTVPPEERIQE